MIDDYNPSHTSSRSPHRALFLVFITTDIHLRPLAEMPDGALSFDYYTYFAEFQRHQYTWLMSDGTRQHTHIWEYDEGEDLDLDLMFITRDIELRRVAAIPDETIAHIYYVYDEQLTRHTDYWRMSNGSQMVTHVWEDYDWEVCKHFENLMFITINIDIELRPVPRMPHRAVEFHSHWYDPMFVRHQYTWLMSDGTELHTYQYGDYHWVKCS